MSVQVKFSLQVLEKIMIPLQKIGINYFGFDRTHLNKPTIRITNRTDWLQAFLANKFENISFFERDPRTYVAGKIFWSELQQEPIYKTAAQHFDIANGITFIHPSYQACEFYHFAVTDENIKTAEFYADHVNFLENFIVDFKINMAEYMQSVCADAFNVDFSDLFLESERWDAFKDIRRYYFNYEGIEGYFTKAEARVIKLLRQGKTANEMMIALNLSDRTCESHIKAIKTKLDCKSLFELGFKLAKLDLHNVVY